MGGSKSTTQTLRPEQLALLQPLADWIRPFLQPGAGASSDALERQLLSSTSAESTALAERTFREGIFNPAIRQFNRTEAPAIASGFASYGGTLSSRRGLTLARARGDVMSGAEDALGRNLLAVQSFPLQQTLAQIQGLGALQTARFTPFHEALQFALSPTQQTTRGSSSPLPSILGALGTIGGALAGGPPGAVVSRTLLTNTRNIGFGSQNEGDR
mgnify:CR=1 FL=1